MAMCLLIPGCSGNGSLQVPSVILDTPSGATPIYTPSPVMPNGAAPAPPGLGPGPSTASQVVDRSGSYAGSAEPLVTGGGLCIQTQKVSGFHVHGRSVRFGGFRGTIERDNGLQMVYGQQWIIGHFEGATFHGQYDVPARFGGPGCTFVLNLQRIGP